MLILKDRCFWYNICIDYKPNKEIENESNQVHIVFVLLTTISCTSGLYTGVEYDDIYFQASDRQLVKARTKAKRQIIENDLRSSDYYDNIYAADTLMSEEYYDAVGYYDDAVNKKGVRQYIQLL